MFVCDACHNQIGEGKKPNKVITEKKPKSYEHKRKEWSYENDEGRRKVDRTFKVTHGWEIAKEINACNDCFKTKNLEAETIIPTRSKFDEEFSNNISINSRKRMYDNSRGSTNNRGRYRESSRRDSQ